MRKNRKQSRNDTSLYRLQLVKLGCKINDFLCCHDDNLLTVKGAINYGWMVELHQEKTRGMCEEATDPLAGQLVHIVVDSTLGHICVSMTPSFVTSPS